MEAQTISRVEEKYLISATQKAQLLDALEQRHLARDRFFAEEILSLYFDTGDAQIANRSIDRPDYRFKLRARTYNIPNQHSPIFFEAKSKLVEGPLHLGNKRRLVLTLGDLYKYLDGKLPLEAAAERYAKAYARSRPEATIPSDPFRQMQFAREIEYLMGLYRPEPRVLISSNRFAYVAQDNPAFRLTFDEDLRFRTEDLRLEHGSRGDLFFTDQTPNIVMEVKTFNAMPFWFVTELSKLKIYPVRFSKYGKIYQYLFETKLRKETYV